MRKLPMLLPFTRRWFACLALLLTVLTGCGPTSSPRGNGGGALRKPPVPLIVLVVDDPALGKAIESEWRSRFEGEVTIRHIASKEVASAQRLPGDLVVFPAGQMGELAEAGLIAPLSQRTLESEDVALRDIYKQIRLHEMKWGDKVYALPLGSPRLMLLYRPDIFDMLGLKPPRTWAEYDALAERLAKREELGELAPAADAPWRGAVAPLGQGYAAHVLLARSAAYAAHKEQVSPLLELTTLKPLISEPPYLRALTEIAAGTPGDSDPRPLLTPQEAFEEILAGRCAMAVTWPASSGTAKAEKPAWPIGFAELPGSLDVYDFSDKKWKTRGPEESPHVPLLTVSGRMVAATSTSSQQEAAEDMAAWMAGSEVAAQICRASPDTTIFRISQEGSAARRLSGIDEHAASQYAGALRQSQERPQRLDGIRLPGREEYLSVLDRAVLDAVQGKESPEEALSAAAKSWEEITRRRGLDGQRRALERSLGLR